MTGRRKKQRAANPSATRLKHRENHLAKQPGETHLEWQMRKARLKADSLDKAEPKVTAEARQHGDYREEFVTDVDTGQKAYTLVNRGGDAITRWIAQKRLSESQQAAIGYVTRLWQISGLRTALTARYGERLAGSANAELRANGEIEARRELHRIQDYIPGSYWNVFENVVRHSMPAGVAGYDVAQSSRNAKHTAYVTVCFVADIIAMNERL